MPRLYSSKHILKILAKNNFVPVSQKGSHLKLENQTGKKLIVIVPANRREIPYGTFRSIVRQSGLAEEDFKKHN